MESVVAAGIYRTILLDKVMNHSYDLTWYVWEMWLATELELFLAIAAASIPALNRSGRNMSGSLSSRHSRHMAGAVLDPQARRPRNSRRLRASRWSAGSVEAVIATSMRIKHGRTTTNCALSMWKLALMEWLRVHQRAFHTRRRSKSSRMKQMGGGQCSRINSIHRLLRPSERVKRCPGIAAVVKWS